MSRRTEDGGVVSAFKASAKLKRDWKKPRRPMRQLSEKRAQNLDAEDVIRQAVIARDMGCVVPKLLRAAGDDPAAFGRCCGIPTYHHKKKASQGGEFTEANGACLCWFHNRHLEQDADFAAWGRVVGLVIPRRAS